MDKQVLYDLGLGKNEVGVYLKLLELGPSTGFRIAKVAKLYRPNVYDALVNLAKKGLVAYFTQNNVKYYEVVEPEQLMALLKSKEIALGKLIPELKVKQLTAKPPSSVAIFEGIAGARKMFLDFIRNTKELYVLGVPKDLVKTVGEGWILDWHMKRERKKIMFYHIVNEDYHIHRIKLLRSMKYVELKFLPKEYNSPNAIIINSTSVTMMFMNPLVSIRIVNKDAVEAFKHYYQMLRKIAKDKAPQERKK